VTSRKTTMAAAPETNSESSLGARALPSRAVWSAELRKLARRAGPLLGFAATLGLMRAIGEGAPPQGTLEGLVEALGVAAHGVVAPSDFVWEKSDGVISDLESGRRILFLLSDHPHGPRHLYRARVQLSPEGRPIAVRNVVRLSTTEEADEQSLVRDESGERAAYAVVAFGRLQNVVALDLRGEGKAARAEGSLDRAMFWVSNLQETGEGVGIARTQVDLEKPATGATLRFEGTQLIAELRNGSAVVQSARVDVDKGELAAPTPGVHATQQIRIPKRPIHWAVDTVRAVVGQEPIAILEAKVWELKDRWKRWRHSGDATSNLVVQKSEAELVQAARTLDPSAAGEDGGYWPPPPVATLYQTPEAGEGQWVPVQPEWMHRIPGAPAPFYKTFVRPDKDRPYSKIILVAMDTRQLDFDMEAGVEDPKPTVGSFHGTGRIPRDVTVAKRTVAAFNGGFKTEHGHYGMMLKHHVLLPPVPTGATAVVTEDGHFGMGAWQPSREIPADILSYRQNMDPLIDDGVVNPRKRQVWGAVLPGQPHLTGQQTERSGLCITKARHTLYVWGDDVGADALGRAMQLAGCDFGMHLDMNPYHTGFVFMSFEDPDYKVGKSETLTPLMAIGNRRYIDYNPKDFFYAMLRDPRPQTFGTSTLAWIADEGVQPPPAWMPAVWHAQASTKAADGAPVSLTLFEAGRVRWALRAGTVEKLDRANDVAREMSGDDAKKVIAAIGLGVDSRHTAMQVAGNTAGAPSPSLGTLALGARGAVVLAAGQALPEGTTDWVQGPPLVADGKPLDSGRGAGDLLRIGVGVTKDGKLIVARARTTSDAPIATALLEAGVVEAIAARGASDAFIARAGTGEAPMSSYPQTTLYAIAAPMGPRAFRFDRTSDGKPAWPVASKPVP
jgi:hypothetical protein